MTSADIPSCPEGVRYIHGNTGEVTMCDLSYTGRNEEGTAIWEITNEGLEWDPNRGDRIEMDSFPPMTGVSFAIPKELIAEPKEENHEG